MPTRWPRARCWSSILALALVGCIGELPPDAGGDLVYKQVCARCHGADLEGGLGPGLGEGSNSEQQDDEFLRLTITEGRGRMPSFSNTLTPEQIERVIDFIRAEQNQ